MAEHGRALGQGSAARSFIIHGPLTGLVHPSLSRDSGYATRDRSRGLGVLGVTSGSPGVTPSIYWGRGRSVRDRGSGIGVTPSIQRVGDRGHTFHSVRGCQGRGHPFYSGSGVTPSIQHWCTRRGLHSRGEGRGPHLPFGSGVTSGGLLPPFTGSFTGSHHRYCRLSTPPSRGHIHAIADSRSNAKV